MRHIVLLLLLLSAGRMAFAQQPQLALAPLATGLNRPVDIASAGDSRLFVAEQRGTIQIINADGTMLTTPFLDIDARVNSTGNEQGLLGLVFHPNYALNGYFFVNYTRSPSGYTRVSRFQTTAANPNIADPNSELVLLEIEQPYENHNAGDLAFGPDGYLYIPMGDGGSGGDPGNRAQNGLTLLGKMIRIDVNAGFPYTIPPSNPFLNDPGVRDEVWSIGLRNPWRFSFDRLTGDMWIADVGQGIYEEINVEPAGSAGGLNYGWRCYEGAHAYNTGGCENAPSYIQPVHEYTHALDGVSITGGFVYRGSKYPVLQGHYIYGDYGSGKVWTLYKDSTGNWAHTSQGELFPNNQLSTFGEDPNGELYAAALNQGIIYKVKETTTAIEDPLQARPLRIFPQPMQESTHIEWPGNGGKFTLRLYDLQGREVVKVNDIQGNTYRLDRNRLPAGWYRIEVTGATRFAGNLLIVD